MHKHAEGSWHRGARPALALAIGIGTVAVAAGPAAAAGHGPGAGHGHHNGGPASGSVVRGVVTTWPTAGGTGTDGATAFEVLVHRHDQVDVEVATTTTYLEKGVNPATIADVVPGERVAVWVTSSAGALVATRIDIAPQHPHALPGVVVSDPTQPDQNGVSSFTLRHGRFTITVDINASTSFVDPAVPAPSASVVTTGERVIVWGRNAWPRTTVYAAKVIVSAKRR